MRAILLVLILGVVALIAAIATGFLSVGQTRDARAPTIQSTDGSLQAQGGQAPSFEVQTGSVEVGTREANVAVPRVEIKRDKAQVDVPTVKVKPAGEPQANSN